MTYSVETIESSNRFADTFVGFYSKDIDPPAQDYEPGNNYLDFDGTNQGTSVFAALDLAPNAQFVPLRTRISAVPNSDITIDVRYISTGASSIIVQNGSTISAVNHVFSDAIDDWLGGATDTATGDGENLSRIVLIVNNELGTTQNVDIGTIRVRGMIFLRGSGTAP